MIETVVEVFGPFVIPVVLFILGVIGYLILSALTKRGILGRE